MSRIDFSDSPLSPNESRAARNFLGLSQAQAAEKSSLPAHKLKRFETGNFVPDGQFLDNLRAFFEGEGYNFHDEDTPGAKAKARGDVFQAGVIGDTTGSSRKTDGSPPVKPGKLPRPQSANLQFMRIAPTLESDQVDRVFEGIEDNEAAIQGALSEPISQGFFSDGPTASSQAQAIAVLRRLAENGLLYAHLMGRELLPLPATGTASKAGTIGALLAHAMADMQRAVIDGDKGAQARRKARAEPTEVMQALVG